LCVLLLSVFCNFSVYGILVCILVCTVFLVCIVFLVTIVFLPAYVYLPVSNPQHGSHQQITV
jgi:hypothetical protein